MTLAAAVDARSVHRRGQLAVAGAALAWSAAGPLQRELSVSPATQVAGRAFFAVLALLAFVVAVERRGTVRAFLSMGWAGLGVAACTAVASGAFVVALNHTTVANVLFMQALAPLAAALIAWAALRERVSRRTAAAMVVAIGGVALMVGGPGASRGLGLALSAAMTVGFALAVVITRHRRDISMAPAICLSQVLVLLVAAPFAEPAATTGSGLLLLVLLGAGQIGLGLALLTIGARLIGAAEVALISLLEVVLGPFWVWLAFSEQPATATLLGGTVVIGAVALQAVGSRPAEPTSSTPRSGR